MTGPVIVRVTKSFSTSPERVFDAWFDPKLIGRWMFGPRLRDEEVVQLKTDPRVGGSFSFLVRRQGMDIDHIGTYREIERPCHIVFTWDIAGMSVEESVVEIDIVANAAGCKLTLTHHMDAKWAEYADRTHSGWTTMLNAQDALFNEKTA